MWEAIFAVVVGYVAFEVTAWFPTLIDRLVCSAAKRLPRRHRERYLEEWRAHIAQTPGAAKRLWDALGFTLAAKRMFPELAARARRRRQWQTYLPYAFYLTLKALTKRSRRAKIEKAQRREIELEGQGLLQRPPRSIEEISAKYDRILREVAYEMFGLRPRK